MTRQGIFHTTLSERKGDATGRPLIYVSARSTGDRVLLDYLFVKPTAARFSPASKAEGGICRTDLPGNRKEEEGQVLVTCVG